MKKAKYQEVLNFWFDNRNQEYWFAKNEDFDQQIYDKFHQTWKKACQGLLWDWRQTMQGRLAEVIVLDQFSRNLCRGKSCAFDQDRMALVLSQEAIAKDGFGQMSQDERQFMIMPFMHSESEEIQKKSVVLFEELGKETSRDFAYKHKEIIDRFGRYPHRNETLDRKSTKEEVDFLKQPGSSF